MDDWWELYYEMRQSRNSWKALAIGNIAIQVAALAVALWYLSDSIGLRVQRDGE
jgi:hypothetical protein